MRDDIISRQTSSTSQGWRISESTTKLPVGFYANFTVGLQSVRHGNKALFPWVERPASSWSKLLRFITSLNTQKHRRGSWDQIEPTHPHNFDRSIKIHWTALSFQAQTGRQTAATKYAHRSCIGMQNNLHPFFHAPIQFIRSALGTREHPEAVTTST